MSFSKLYVHYNRSDEFAGNMLDDKKWMDETNPSELASTANQLLAGVGDPKLTNSEVA